MTPPRHCHDQPERTGILLVNLGTPDSPERGAVRRYLKEFLWDPRVVEAPRLPWWLALHLAILPRRSGRSAAAYRKIWTEEGSPLLAISRRQADAIAARLRETHGDAVAVALAMRYGRPAITEGLERLREAGARRLLVLPLYPQYSATTTASVIDAVCDTLRGWRWLPELRFINHYHDDPGYIAALAASVRDFQAGHGRPERLLLSFHGIPQDYFEKGDPYFCECQKTARLLAEALQLDDDAWTLSFQSRLGPKQWLQPYTDRTLERLAAEGVRSVQVLCPGFSADCLETLEEVAMENRDIFLAAGGERYEYIPCLNDRPDHVQALCGLLQRHMAGWETPETDLAARQARARALGAEC